MLRVSFYYTQIKKAAEAIFFIFCVFVTYLTLPLNGDINSRNQSQLFAKSLDLVRLCLNDGLKDPGILSDLVDIQLGLGNWGLVLQKYPVLVLVKHARVNANAAITIKYLTHNVRSCRSIVDLLHVNERFQEARLALNRNKIYAADDADADDRSEDALDARLVVLGEHAGNEEADRRHVGFGCWLALSDLIIIALANESIFPYFVLNQGTYGSPTPSLLSA